VRRAGRELADDPRCVVFCVFFKSMDR
jgi:hypothetical protein